MSFNAKKCIILRISCSKSPIKYQYTIHVEPLEAVEHHKYLEVDLSSVYLEYKNLETSRNLQGHSTSQIFRIHQGTNSTRSEQRNSIFLTYFNFCWETFTCSDTHSRAVSKMSFPSTILYNFPDSNSEEPPRGICNMCE